MVNLGSDKGKYNRLLTGYEFYLKKMDPSKHLVFES